jgi:two-component system, LytTR family, response regulator
MGIKTLIVDDEPLALEGLRMLLAQDPDIAGIKEAPGGLEAVEAIAAWNPDLVFLDVQMPEMDGFDVIKAVGAERMPAVVFATAHDRHAVRAFEANAIDYLLKPIPRDRFTAALKRAKARVGAAQQDPPGRQIISLLQSIARPAQRLKRLAVRSAGKTTFVNVEDIDWIRAADNYVELHSGDTCHLVHCSMNEMEGALNPEDFLRIHRSLIVNAGRVKEVRAASFGEYLIVLQTGQRLQSSRRYAQSVRSLIQNPF